MPDCENYFCDFVEVLTIRFYLLTCKFFNFNFRILNLLYCLLFPQFDGAKSSNISNVTGYHPPLSFLRLFQLGVIILSLLNFKLFILDDTLNAVRKMVQPNFNAKFVEFVVESVELHYNSVDLLSHIVRPNNSFIHLIFSVA
jgi:hypothetical protein